MTEVHNTSECAGNRKIQELISKREIEDLEEKKRVCEAANQWADRFKKDLCCVEYPTKRRVFNFPFNFSNVIEKNQPVVTIENDRFLRIDLPGVSVSDWTNFVQCSERRTPCGIFGTFQDAHKKVYFSFVVDTKGVWNRGIESDGWVSYEKMFDVLCSELAHYVRKFKITYEGK